MGDHCSGGWEACSVKSRCWSTQARDQGRQHQGAGCVSDAGGEVEEKCVLVYIMGPVSNGGRGLEPITAIHRPATVQPITVRLGAANHRPPPPSDRHRDERAARFCFLDTPPNDRLATSHGHGSGPSAWPCVAASGSVTPCSLMHASSLAGRLSSLCPPARPPRRRQRS